MDRCQQVVGRQEGTRTETSGGAVSTSLYRLEPLWFPVFEHLNEREKMGRDGERKGDFG